MNVAVTGGSGQLGTLVLRRLARERRVRRITAIDVRPPAVAHPKVKALLRDVRDPDLAEAFEGCDAVVHLAFVVTGFPPRAVMDAINVGGSRNVFEAAAKARVGHVVYSSSVAAYGVVPGHPDPIVETTARVHQRHFAYAANKYEVEEILDRFEAAHPGMAITRFRPGVLIGTHMDHPLGAELRARRLMDTASAPFPLVWDDDVADAVWLALEKRAHGAFNLVADAPATLSELARATGMRHVRVPRVLALFVAHASVPLARLGVGRAMDPSWIAVGSVPLRFSSARARDELGWTPRHATSTEVVRHFCQVAPVSAPDRRITRFFRLLALGARRVELTPEQRRMNVRIHVALDGPGGGDFTLAIEGGKLSAAPGIPRPPTAVVGMSAATFLDLVAGRADYASSQMMGRIRIEGEALSAFVLNASVMFFRAAAEKKGAGGYLARRLMSAMAREAA